MTQHIYNKLTCLLVLHGPFIPYFYGYSIGTVQSYDWPIANETILRNLGNQATLIHWYEQHGINETKQNKTTCTFYDIFCSCSEKRLFIHVARTFASPDHCWFLCIKAWISSPSARSPTVSKPRDWISKWSHRSEIWQAPRQHCCRYACQSSEWSETLNGFENSRILATNAKWIDSMVYSWYGISDHCHARSKARCGNEMTNPSITQDSIMMSMKFSDLSQLDHSNWVMWQVKDPCPRPWWDRCLRAVVSFPGR